MVSVPTFVTPDGANLHYEIFGDGGKPIVFLHGWGVSSAFFSEQIPPLTENGYRTILLDSRMNGKSEKQTSIIPEIYKDNLLELLLEDFFDFKEFIGLDEPYMIFGHSAGGAISACITTMDPENVKALAIINSSYTISENPAILVLWELVPLFVRAIYNPHIRNAYRMVLRTKTVQYSLSLSMDLPLSNIQAWIDDVLTIPKQALLLEYKNIKRTNIKEKLAQIRCPTLVVSSDLDLVTPAIMSKTIHKIIPQSEFYLIKNAGHLAMIEQKEKFNDILLNFLKNHY